MIEQLSLLADQLEPQLIADRRDFHRHAETGWCEFRTASLVARRLAELGWEVQLGRQVIDVSARMGVPPPEVLEARWERAAAQAGDPTFLPAVRGGFTGVVGTLRGGDSPAVGLRFDMDALDLQESDNPDHRPARESWASVNPEAAHACGHDAHTTVGLGLAALLAALKERLCGTVKLIFQPAEEGVRGAQSMVAAGVVDDLDYLLAHHFVTGWALGELVAGRSGFLATRKFDAILTGRAAHAGGSPEAGKNALLAAAAAVLNLYAIPQHGSGMTRLNVGRLAAGSGRNIIPAQAHLVMETRGADDALSDYMYKSAVRVLQTAAAMYDCELEIRPMGAAGTASSDPELATQVEAVAAQLGGFVPLEPTQRGGSEDFTAMMARVQARGGRATYLATGADLHGISHHDRTGREAVLAAHSAIFDLDERALKKALVLLAAVALDLTGSS